MYKVDKDLADVLIETAKLTLAIVGGIWVYFRFRKERTHTPRVSFDIDAEFLGSQADSYVTELRLTIKNAGLVRHKFQEISLRIRGIERDQPISLWRETQRVEFPVKIVSDADVMHKARYSSIFVEPGVTQVITFVARIPSHVSFVQARAVFHYDETRTHSTERVFGVVEPRV